jgi:hypothetical protein
MMTAMDTLTVPDGHRVTTYRVGAEPALRTSDGKAWLAHLVTSSDDTERELLGESDVTRDAREAGDESCRLDPPDGLDRAADAVDMAARSWATA